MVLPMAVAKKMPIEMAMPMTMAKGNSNSNGNIIKRATTMIKEMEKAMAMVI